MELRIINLNIIILLAVIQFPFSAFGENIIEVLEIVVETSSRSETLRHVVDGENFIFKKQDFPLIFSCLTNQPSQWVFRGHGQENLIDIHKHKTKNGNYTSSATISAIGEERIGHYACKLEQNLEISKSFYIFIQNDAQLPRYLNTGKSLIVQPHRFDPIILPCAVSDPGKLEKSQFYVNYHGVFSSTKMDFPFDPKRGFVIENLDNKKYTGEYRCMNDENPDDFVQVGVRDTIDYYIKPEVPKIIKSSNLEVTCSSIAEISIIFDDSQLRNVDITYTIQPFQPYRYTAVLKYEKLAPGDNGKILCVRKNGRLIHSWDFEQRDFDMEINVEKTEDNYQENCVGRPGNYYLRSLNCTYLDECLVAQNWMKAESYAKIDKFGQSSSSVSISKFGGHLVTCISEGILLQEIYFRGLNGHLYNSNEEVAAENLIIAEMNEFILICKWIPFYLMENITWTVQYTNGSMQIFENQEIVFRETGILESSISTQNFDYPVSSIRCSVPYWKFAKKFAEAIIVIGEFLPKAGDINFPTEDPPLKSLCEICYHSELEDQISRVDMILYLIVCMALTACVVSLFNFFIFYTKENYVIAFVKWMKFKVVRVKIMGNGISGNIGAEICDGNIEELPTKQSESAKVGTGTNEPKTAEIGIATDEIETLEARTESRNIGTAKPGKKLSVVATNKYKFGSTKAKQRPKPINPNLKRPTRRSMIFSSDDDIE